MKMMNNSKAVLLQILVVSSLFMFAACGNTQNQDDTMDMTQHQNDANMGGNHNNNNNNNQEKDAEFLVKAAEMDLKEIQLGQLAQQKGTSTDVRELGKMMVETHTKTLADLNALATSKSITVPNAITEKAQDEYNNLSEKSGNDFDKAYADRMVSEHKDAINTFENASTECNDAQIKNWASSTLPALRQHLQHAEGVHTKTKNM